ncbi:MAG: InlB B-repeat-containing protein [Clostridia bacterium]|nr:InlB B-repeat-containing protein [Clostridia bacterium]
MYSFFLFLRSVTGFIIAIIIAITCFFCRLFRIPCKYCNNHETTTVTQTAESTTVTSTVPSTEPVTEPGSKMISVNYRIMLESEQEGAYYGAGIIKTGVITVENGSTVDYDDVIISEGFATPEGYVPDESAHSVPAVENQTCNFKLKRIKFDVTWNNGDGTKSVSAERYDCPVTSPVPERENYTFAGWYRSETDAASKTGRVDFGDTYNPVTLKSAAEFYAGWDFISHNVTLTWKDIDGTEHTAEVQTSEDKTTVLASLEGIMPAEDSVEGYRFVLYTDSEYKNPVTDSTAADSDMRVYGRFEPTSIPEYKVTWIITKPDGTVVTDDTSTSPKHEGDEFTDADVPALEMFPGYEPTITGAEPEFNGIMPASDLRIYVGYSLIEYTVTWVYTDANGSRVEEYSRGLHFGDDVPDFPGNTGENAVIEWAVPSSVVDGKMPASDVTINGTYYSFAEVEIDLETETTGIFEKAASGRVKFIPGTAVTFEETANQLGYTVPDGFEPGPNSESIIMTEGGTYSAELNRKAYEITWNADNGYDPQITYGRHGLGVIPPTVRKTNHTFSGWYLTAADAENLQSPVDFSTYTVTQKTDFYAAWTLTAYTATCRWTDLDGNDRVSITNNIPLGAKITENIASHIPAADSETGYLFVLYKDSGFGTPLTEDNTSDSDITVYGRYELIDYTITWTYTLPGETQPSVFTETANMGDTVTDYAHETVDGYGFMWEDYDEIMPASDITINGIYAENSYPVKMILNGKTVHKELVTAGNSVPGFTPDTVPKGMKFVVVSDIPEAMPAADLVLECAYVPEDYTITWTYIDPNGSTYTDDTSNTTMHYGDEIPDHSYAEFENYSFLWKYPDTLEDGKMPAQDITITGEYTYIGPPIIYKDSFGGTDYEIVTGASRSGGDYWVCGRSNSDDGDFAALLPSDYTKTIGSLNHTYGFIAKYDKNANRTVLKTVYDDSKAVYVTGISAISNSNVAVCGYTIDTSNSRDAFVAVYDSEGTQKVFRILEGSGNDRLSSIASVPGGFAAGGETFSLDGDYASLPAGHSSNAFIMKFKYNNSTNELSIVFIKSLGGSKTADVPGLSSDSAGNIYASVRTTANDGDFAAFSGLTGSTFDNIILKYNSSGTLMWSYVLAGSGNENFDCVVADGAGGCAVAGYYTMPGSANTGTIADINNVGGIDSVLIKLSSSGSRSWFRVIGGLKDDYAIGLARSGSNYVITGYTNSSNREFDENYGGYDGFMDVVSSNGKQTEYFNIGGSHRDVASAVAANGTDVMVFGYSTSIDNWFEGINSNITDEIRETWGQNEYYDCFAGGYSISDS